MREAQPPLQPGGLQPFCLHRVFNVGQQNQRMPIPRWSLTQLARRLRPAHRLHHVYERVLGTELEVQIVADTRLQAEGAERAALTEIDRLTAILNRFDHDSELRRWQANPGVRTPLSDDLKAVLRAADHWREVTGGAFHPGADALGMCWKQAEERGRLPEDQDLTALAAQLRLPPWTLDSDGTGTFQAMYPVGLNALAKGYVVDRAAEAAFGEPGVRTVLINVGATCGPWGKWDWALPSPTPSVRGMTSRPCATSRCAMERWRRAGNLTAGTRWGRRGTRMCWTRARVIPSPKCRASRSRRQTA